jgi:hypothetical protein
MRFAAIACALFTSIPQLAQAEERAVVAVFVVKEAGGWLSKNVLESLTVFLAARMAEGKVFIVVPQAQVKAAIESQVKASFSACTDESCQIEIGRELAAQKLLQTEVIRVGNQCAITSTLFDLKLAASENSATVRVGCEEEALVGAVEQAADVLKRELLDAKQRAADRAAREEADKTLKLEAARAADAEREARERREAEALNTRRAQELAAYNDEAGSSSTMRTLGYLIGGGGALLVGGGLLFSSASSSNENMIRNGGFATGTELSEAASAARTQDGAAIAMWSVGGAVLATGIAFVLLNLGPDAPSGAAE